MGGAGQACGSGGACDNLRRLVGTGVGGTPARRPCHFCFPSCCISSSCSAPAQLVQGVHRRRRCLSRRHSAMSSPPLRGQCMPSCGSQTRGTHPLIRPLSAPMPGHSSLTALVPSRTSAMQSSATHLISLTFIPHVLRRKMPHPAPLSHSSSVLMPIASLYRPRRQTELAWPSQLLSSLINIATVVHDMTHA